MRRFSPSSGIATAFAARPRPRWVTLFCVSLTALSWLGCRGATPTSADAAPDAATDGESDTGTDAVAAAGLRINELCPDDDGFQVDEEGQTDDWIELYNGGAAPVRLEDFTLGEAGGRAVRLPAQELGPGAAALLWADGTPGQGPRHLAFRLSAGGGQLALRTAAGALVDEVQFPALATNTAWARTPDGEGAFAACRYATPGRPNGGRCGPAPPVDHPPDVQFPPFTWPASFGQPAGPVVISEAGLRPAAFLELVNRGAAAEDLADLALRIGALDAATAWPGLQAGREVAWPRAGMLAPGERLVVTVDDVALTEVTAAGYEGVVSLFRRSSGQVLHRLDFARLPAGAVLALPEPAPGPGSDRPTGTHRLCLNATPGAANASCDPVASRDVGDRLRQIQSPGDLAALAAGGAEVDSQAVKFVVDLQADPGGQQPAVHFLSSRAWPLHYQFIRERIYLHPHLDRCSPIEAPVFLAGWQEFSDREYYKSEGRRFLLGTLVRYGGSNLQTVEFERADVITGPQMQLAFRVVAQRLPDPAAWVLRAQGRQVEALRPLETTLPLVDADAPFRGVRLQPMDPGVAFGVLRFVPAGDLAGDTTLGRDVVLITDDVPNDVPLVGGLITEAFQTPLSHVSILSRNRGTPNMALREARNDPRVMPLLDQLVRLEVISGTFSLRAATPAEAQAFWDTRRPPGPRVAPRLDTNLRGLQELAGRGLDDLPSVGAKAAQLAELMRIESADPGCAGRIPTPPIALAIPVVHSLDHAAASGATTLLAQHRARPEFAADPRVRAQALAEVRAAILAYPVDGPLLASVEARARALFGTRRFRLRSSSNAEDLPGFSGAGLYQSVSVALGDPERPLEDGIRQVWASLWFPRAYDERELANIDHERVAMGILINEAYPGVERANGVAVSRDVKNPLRGDTHYLSAQLGEASVTNPAPGVVSESLTYTWWLPTPVERLSSSSLQSTPVLAPAEIERISCLMRAVHQHFQFRLDPDRRNRWFTMESEFKLVGQGRMLILKQARPYVFGSFDVPADCREL